MDHGQCSIELRTKICVLSSKTVSQQSVALETTYIKSNRDPLVNAILTAIVEEALYKPRHLDYDLYC